MTRERYNELKRVSKERYESEHEQALFIDGAEWADQHPRKGIWDAEKVIEWLRNNQHGFILTDMDIEDLRKALED